MIIQNTQVGFLATILSNKLLIFTNVNPSCNKSVRICIQFLKFVNYGHLMKKMTKTNEVYC